ncbi:hypothetical protein M413DRAFT_438218 [Hebeloma cylindrosporum]|uniref:L-ornithine N(5)-monooxygenase [NAD(P)H] n=1 Tax=Hebeloma cylindrosporum TaxID=76867 RepID=A0A0C3CK11_HEBCY|nr:hypothetical protein M413DRAFT_438218 [Hebeloma cylindrosporum h7]
MLPPSQKETVFDLIGLGFGPANIAIACALTEDWENQKASSPHPVQKVLFIEKHKIFRWHPGMLLPNAKMQISFMKDLATLRNPQSPYTFLSYLHSQGRLVSFINRGSTVPTRKEYSDYLSWAAQRVQDQGVNVFYGHEVVGIERVDDTIAVRYRNLSSGEEAIVRSRNIILAPGGSPRVPTFIQPLVKRAHVIHSSAYATSINNVLAMVYEGAQSKPLRLAVIGSGQSAAEVTMDLRERLSSFPSATRHHIDLLIRKGALKPSDDSPFANEIFNPESTDAWFSLSSRHLRDKKLSEYELTNYGVVNARTLESLYEIIYSQRLDDGIAHRTGYDIAQADPFITIKPYTLIKSMKLEQGAEVDLLLSSESSPRVPDAATISIMAQNIISQAIDEEKYDVVIYATGYERSSWIDILKYSGMGACFGLRPSSSNVRLVPARTASHRTGSNSVIEVQPHSGNFETSSPSSSIGSTPPTSPEIGTFDTPSFEAPQELYISRNYRLLPLEIVRGSYLTKPQEFTPRIYVQGVEEYTHGLSDTLLSVLGVRAGEVVRDLRL